MEWFERIRERRHEVLRDPENGRPCTPVPEDVFQVRHA
jgi:hypothetical protein